MLVIDEEVALAAIPAMLPEAVEERRAAFRMLNEVVGARGSLSEAGAQRLERVASLFRVASEPTTLGTRAETHRRKAS